MSIVEYLSKQSKLILVAVGFALVAVMGFVDYLTGPDLSFIIFYLAPIFLVSWFVGKRAGTLIAAASGIAWLLADVMTRTSYVHPAIPYWNVTVKMGFFVIVSQILSSLKSALEREKDMARTDHLTGVANSRYFFELSENEIHRAGRYLHPFSVAYMDIDNFKAVNDSMGHSAGDALLALVAETVGNTIRSTDTVARLGGDEFAMLLPETGFEAAEVVIRKVFDNLSDAVQAKPWPVSFSMGVVTFLNPPGSVDEMLRLADGLMYTAKGGGKNAIKHKEVSYPLTTVP